MRHRILIFADTFTKNHTRSVHFPLDSISPKAYKTAPITTGEHIRKKRIDLSLTQHDVAKIIGVTRATVWNWEHGRKPEVRHIPKIIEFLGYVPFERPVDPIGKLKHFKLVHGLSLL